MYAHFSTPPPSISFFLSFFFLVLFPSFCVFSACVCGNACARPHKSLIRPIISGGNSGSVIKAVCQQLRVLDIHRPVNMAAVKTETEISETKEDDTSGQQNEVIDDVNGDQAAAKKKKKKKKKKKTGMIVFVIYDPSQACRTCVASDSSVTWPASLTPLSLTLSHQLMIKTHLSWAPLIYWSLT